tara:strand:+ start:304 stop:597 length:294 start_codon:yes stop_codon:yes gene_type:complete
MTVTIILEIKAKAGTSSKILDILEEVLPDTRSYDGCLGLKTYQNQENPDIIVLVEEFESREKYSQYLSWRQETGVFDSLAQELEEPPSIRYFDLKDA